MKKVLFIALPLLFFNITCRNKVPDVVVQQHQADLHAIATEMNAAFVTVSHVMDSLVQQTYSCYEQQNEILKTAQRGYYKAASSGVFYKAVNDGGSAVFVSRVHPITDDVKKIVYFTEPLDKIFKHIKDTYPEVVQVYYNDENSINRIYPFFDVLAQYEPNLNIPEFNFYYFADAAHNPGKGPVWVKEPYVDPAGRGWMVSLIAPVYFHDRLVGVPGMDITIQTVTDGFLARKKDDYVMLIDSSGVIVAAQEKIINLFSFPPLKDHKYIETIKSNTFRRETYNILLSKDQTLRNLASEIILKRQSRTTITFNNTDYVVISEYIPELHWFLLEVIS